MIGGYIAGFDMDSGSTAIVATKEGEEDFSEIPSLGHADPAQALLGPGLAVMVHFLAQAQAEEPLPNVRGLAFLGFPLHPAGKPDVQRLADRIAAMYKG